jgi:hypothetical protein
MPASDPRFNARRPRTRGSYTGDALGVLRGDPRPVVGKLRCQRSGAQPARGTYCPTSTAAAAHGQTTQRPVVRQTSAPPTHDTYRIAGRPLGVINPSHGGESAIDVSWRMNRSLPSHRGGRTWQLDAPGAEFITGQHAIGDPRKHCYHATIYPTPADATSLISHPTPGKLAPISVKIKHVASPAQADMRLISYGQAVGITHRLKCR